MTFVSVALAAVVTLDGCPWTIGKSSGFVKGGRSLGAIIGNQEIFTNVTVSFI